MTERSIVGISEAARRLGVHPNTLRKWADDGTIPSLRMPSGHRRFDVEELARFKEAMVTHRANGRQKAPGQQEPVEDETLDTACS